MRERKPSQERKLTLNASAERGLTGLARHSYKYIELSVRHGVLENLEDHIVGPPEGTVRSIGSVVRPAKTTRNKYTQEDERILWDWVQTNPQKFGGTDGNEIYKQLETIVSCLNRLQSDSCSRS